MKVKGVFLSDLHLFSRRSVGQQRWNQWQAVLANLDLLILGGDIFDFRWSSHHRLIDSVTAAENWLVKLNDLHPNLRTLFVMGNHDCLPELQSALGRLTAYSSRFGWSDNHIRLGDKLFLHGDILDAGGFGESLKQYRAQFLEHRPRGALANHLYDALVAARVHQLPARWIHEPSRVTTQMSKYLLAEQLGQNSGVAQVFFGHTHAPITGREHARQIFFNSGSGIKHLGFNPVTFEIDSHRLDELDKFAFPGNATF